MKAIPPTGLWPVTVNKLDLIERIKENRNNHHDTYTQALAGYKQKILSELDDIMTRVAGGDILRVQVVLPFPEEHLEDYDTALEMLQMSVDDKVTLTQPEFETLVRDNWGWAHSFAASTASYLVPEE